MRDFKELEFKYKADEVKLQDFIKLMQDLDFDSNISAASWDIYYVKNDNEFQRFRKSKTEPELTKKIKTNINNSWDRVESDLPLDPKRVTEELVAFHVGLDGYKENFRVYKVCEVFWKDNFNYVYYITYDINMKELGRFIEVELNKNKVSSLLSESDKSIGTFEGPKQALNIAAKVLEKLNLYPANRMKKSLFELYKK